MAAFGPDDLKVTSRESYVGNECDTDEYRETQPEKGVRHVRGALEILVAAGRTDDAVTLEERTITWLRDAGVEVTEGATLEQLEARIIEEEILFGAYEGADDLTPILEQVHDILWDAGEHPYFGDVAELRESL